MAEQVYALIAPFYHQLGWPCVLPVPPETKSPPPTGFTGEEGADTTAADIQNWINGGLGGYSVALRMPHGIIGIDVDDYLKGAVQKRGGETLAAAVERWGELPPTWSSTARGQGGVSRIRFYQVPAQRYATVIQPDIEIIQRHHRYAVVGPSTHLDTGPPVVVRTYQWYGPDGELSLPPSPGALPWLPEAWVEGLREGAVAVGPRSADRGSGEALLAQLSGDMRPACPVVADAIDACARLLSSPDSGTRHDAMTARVHRLVLTAAGGHPGLGLLLPALREQWNLLTAGEGREEEFERMLLTSARKGVTQRGNVDFLTDPCLAMGGSLWADVHVPMVDARPRPADDREYEYDDEENFEPISDLPPKLVDPSWGQVLGTEPFDPESDIETTIADHMLRRAFYMTRRASDMKSAWLLRGAELWNLESDLARRVVAELARLMPVGDPTPATPGIPTTAEQRQYKRRIRMLTNAPGAAVASVIRAVTDGGRHPACISVADLDNDPEVLWAGGWAWDLKAGIEQPTIAQHVDPNTPHLMGAGVGPAPVPTPRWDAFIAAVWPDPEVRAWCLRVLSIAFTGHPDEAIPVLFGPGGSGKSSTAMLLMDLLGTYAHSGNPKLLSDRADQFMTFSLKGRRLTFIDEAMREGVRNAETLKQLTGGVSLTGAKKNQNEITFRPTHTLVLTSNDPPTITDEALRRRVRLLPCEGNPDTVRAARQALGQTWEREAPGVLAFMMVEASRWLADRNSARDVAAPAVIRQAGVELVEQQSPVDSWVEACTLPDAGGTEAGALYLAFLAWFEGSLLYKRQAPPTSTRFGRRLGELGYPVMVDPATGTYVKFGPKRNQKGRPLAILGGGSGWAPVQAPGSPYNTWSPNVSDFVQPISDSSPSDSSPGGSNRDNVQSPEKGVSDSQLSENANCLSQLSDAYLPSSTPLSSSSSDSSDSWFPKRVEDEEGYTESSNGIQRVTGGECGERIGEHVELSEVINKPSRSSNEANNPQVDQTFSNASSGEGEQAVGGIVAGQPDFSTSAKIDLPPKRAGRLSDEEKATRAAARKLIKDEASAAERRARVAEAAGPLYPLPVIVDRAGTVTACSAHDARSLIAAGIRADGALTVDVEHNGYPVGHRLFELRTVQLGNHSFAAVFDPVTHADEIRALLDQAPLLHAFSAQADLVPLAEYGLIGDLDDAWRRMVDPSLIVQLAGMVETERESSGLKAICAKLLGLQAVSTSADEARSRLFKAGGWSEASGWANVDPCSSTMLVYAACDVLDTAALLRRLPEVPAGPGSSAAAILGRERAIQAMTARVTSVGLALDQAHIEPMKADHEALRASLGLQLAGMGVENPGSPQQVATAASALGARLPQTPTGKPSASKEALTAFKNAEGPLGEMVRAQLQWRHYDTALKMFLVPFTEQITEGDSRIRPTTYTLGTDTGRFSCTRPNVQQLSREGGIRACIVADPGDLLIGADFSGIELRVAAALSGDTGLKEMLIAEHETLLRDPDAHVGLHWEVARMVYGPEATKADRYNVKRIVFGRLYGGGIPKLAAQCGISEPMAASIVDVLDMMTPGVKAFGDELKNFVRGGGRQFPTYSGRIVHFPAGVPHKALNYAVQGSARELTVDAMLDWRLTEWGNRVMFAVHDELDVMVPEQDAERATTELVRCMTRELNGVRIVAEASKPSRFWADSV